MVVFAVGGIDYALETADVREVLRMVAVTPLPEAPDWLAGIVNIRGRITPIVDLRTRFGFPAGERALSTPIVVAERRGGPVGLIADEVSGIVDFVDGDLHRGGRGADGISFVTGIAESHGRMVLIADLDAVCAGVESHLPAAG